MKSIAYLLLPGLALTSHASAANKVTANFDNIPGSAIPSPIGTYEYITYNAFDVVDVEDSILKVIQTHTPPNAIVTDSQEQSHGTPSLTVAKPYTAFGLTDFYFGCASHTAESAANVATQCTITVAAFENLLDKEVATASFTFTPPPLSVGVAVPMIHAVLPNTFQAAVGIKDVTIIQDNPTTEALLADSFSYYLYE